MFTFLMDDVGIPLNYRHMEGFGVHTYTLMTRDGKVRLESFSCFLFFVSCLRVPRAASGGRNLLLLSLYSLSFPLFFSFLSICLSSEESYRRQGKREKRASEREAAPLSAARGVFGERFFSSFLCLTLSPSLPPQQQRQKNSLHRRPTSSSTGSPPAASSASSTPRPSASAAPTTRTRRRTSSSRSPRGTTPSGSS